MTAQVDTALVTSPAWQAYQDNQRNARNRYLADTEAASRDYNDGVQVLKDTYHRRELEAWQDYQSSLRVAWEAYQSTARRAWLDQHNIAQREWDTTQDAALADRVSTFTPAAPAHPYPETES